MIARPPPSYEWTLHPGLTDYGAVCTLFGHTYAVFAVRPFRTSRITQIPYTAPFFFSPDRVLPNNAPTSKERKRVSQVNPGIEDTIPLLCSICVA